LRDAARDGMLDAKEDIESVTFLMVATRRRRGRI
jgi:hypothetical protein